MKKTIAILVIGLIAALLDGCTQPASDTNSASKNVAPAATNSAAQASTAGTENKNGSAANANQSSASSPANANSNANVSSSSAVTSPIDPAKLLGTYEMNQIQKEGVSTMITQAKIAFIFNADGRYNRVATAKGKTVNTQSGQFSIVGDKLTFKIQLMGKQINTTPIEKNYTIALSPDGRELKMTSKTGETATFYRIH